MAVSGIQAPLSAYWYATLVLFEEQQISEEYLILFEEGFKDPNSLKNQFTVEIPYKLELFTITHTHMHIHMYTHMAVHTQHEHPQDLMRTR